MPSSFYNSKLFLSFSVFSVQSIYYVQISAVIILLAIISSKLK